MSAIPNPGSSSRPGLLLPLLLSIFLLLAVGLPLFTCYYGCHQVASSISGQGSEGIHQLTDLEIRVAVVNMKQAPGVRDAAVAQEGRTLSLVLVVDWAMDKAMAKKLGESFARFLKAPVGGESRPDFHDLGPGTYNYMITIARSDKPEIAEG